MEGVDTENIKLLYSCYFFKMKIWRNLEADPLFQHPQATLSVDEERHLVLRQMYRLKQYNFLPFEEVVADVRKVNIQ
jgi:hypothetical protein